MTTTILAMRKTSNQYCDNFVVSLYQIHDNDVWNYEVNCQRVNGGSWSKRFVSYTAAMMYLLNDGSLR